MAQWVKCGSHKQGDLCPVALSGQVSSMSLHSRCRTARWGQSLKASVSVTHSNEQQGTVPQTRWKVATNTLGCPLTPNAFSGMHTQTSVHMHVCTHTRTYSSQFGILYKTCNQTK